MGPGFVVTLTIPSPVSEDSQSSDAGINFIFLEKFLWHARPMTVPIALFGKLSEKAQLHWNPSRSPPRSINFQSGAIPSPNAFAGLKRRYAGTEDDKKGQSRSPAEVFKRGSRRKDFSDHMQTGHSVPETDEIFQELLDRLEETEKRSSHKFASRQLSPGAFANLRNGYEPLDCKARRCRYPGRINPPIACCRF